MSVESHYGDEWMDYVGIGTEDAMPPKIETANAVLASFFDGRIEQRKSGMFVCWLPTR